MGDDGFQDVGLALDAKVKPPVSRYPGLPEVPGLVVFLGVQARISKIAQQVMELLRSCQEITFRLYSTAGQASSGTQ